MKRLVSAFVIVGALGLAGCTSQPIQNVENAPVTTIDKKASAADVQKAILRAGAALGWQMKTVRPGLIEGRLALRKHVAVVEIPYTARSYSIRYKDSTNLGHDGDNIHRNYNGWVQNLDRNIQSQLAHL